MGSRESRRTAIPTRRALIAIYALGIASLPRAYAEPAPADDGAVVIGGGAADHDRTVVSAAVVAAARAAGWFLSREPIAQDDTDQLLGCADPDQPWGCVPASIDRRGIHRIFVVAVDKQQADSGAPLVILTARLIVTAPRVLVVRQRFCEHCADDRLTAASAELTQQLLQDLAVRAGRTILDVESTPSGARITLDGHPIGMTNATFNTFPGLHVVIVDKAGHRSEIRTVIAEEGRTAAVAVTLVPSPGAAPAVGAGRLPVGALIAGGAVAIVAGGVLLDLGRQDGPDDRYRYVGATPAGAVIGIAGLATLVTGIYLWRRAPASSVPTVGITSSSGVVAGWTAAF